MQTQRERHYWKQKVSDFTPPFSSLPQLQVANLAKRLHSAKANTLIALIESQTTQLCNAVYKCLLELSGKHQIIIISVTELATIVGYQCFWGTHWSINESEPTIHLQMKCMLKCLSYSHYSH